VGAARWRLPGASGHRLARDVKGLAAAATRCASHRRNFIAISRPRRLRTAGGIRWQRSAPVNRRAPLPFAALTRRPKHVAAEPARQAGDGAGLNREARGPSPARGLRFNRFSDKRANAARQGDASRRKAASLRVSYAAAWHPAACDGRHFLGGTFIAPTRCAAFMQRATAAPSRRAGDKVGVVVGHSTPAARVLTVGYYGFAGNAA